jgi:hypothetical protein
MAFIILFVEEGGHCCGLGSRHTLWRGLSLEKTNDAAGIINLYTARLIGRN